MKRAVIGVVQSSATDGKVLVVGRPAAIETALAVFERNDPDETEHVKTPRFDFEWIPADVLALGSVDTSVHDGDFLEFDPSLGSAIIERLQAHGYQVERDDPLIQKSEGYGM